MTSTKQHSHRVLASRPLARFAQLLTLSLLFTLAMSPAAQAQTFTILHNFTGGSDGYYPTAGLTLKGSGNLYGGAGPDAVFRFSRAGTGWVMSPIFEFNGTDGGSLTGRLTVGPDGALFGASYFGGIPDCADGAGCGLILNLRPPGSFCRNPFCWWIQAILYQFNPLNVPGDGYFPNGGIVFDTAGNLYGTTVYGVQSQGTVYEISPSGGGWVENSIYEFSGGADGGSPQAGMVMDQAGNLYGATYGGGIPLACLAISPVAWSSNSRRPPMAGWRPCCTPLRTAAMGPIRWVD